MTPDPPPLADPHSTAPLPSPPARRSSRDLNWLDLVFVGVTLIAWMVNIGAANSGVRGAPLRIIDNVTTLLFLSTIIRAVIRYKRR